MKRLTVEEINKRLPERSRFIAIDIDYNKSGNAIFRCECGTIKSIRPRHIFDGNTVSCGCRMKINPHTKKYSMRVPNLYSIWERMVHRCHNENDSSYKYYGGRGVIVCDEWRNNYQNFLDWALAHGWQKGLQLDKDIKGTGKIYSPDHCIWVTSKENCNKKRNNRTFDYYGELLSLTKICEKEDVEYFFVIDRIRKNGFDIYKAIRMAKNKIAA